MNQAASLSAVSEDDLRDFEARHPLRRDRTNLWWRVGVGLEILAFVVIWEALSRIGVLPPKFMPAPSSVASSFVSLFGMANFVGNLGYTLTNLAIGLVLASAFGISIGLTVGWFRLLELTVGPLLWVLYVIPKVALAPLIILWLGIGPPSQIALVFLMAVYPLMLNTIDGVRTIDLSLIRAARVFGVRRTRLFTQLMLPATLPFVLVGLRRGVALGFIGAILGEFLGGSVGIGKTLQQSVFKFRLAEALAIVAIMVLVTNGLLLLLDLVRRRLAPWFVEDSAKSG